MLALTVLCVASSGPSCDSAGVKCLAGRGEMHDSTLALTEVLWVGPENKEVYVGSPSIWKVHSRCFASHDFFGRTTIGDTVQVFVDDSGACSGTASAWRYAGNVSGMYWANLFTLPLSDTLYLLGVSSGDRSTSRSIVLSQSTDGAVSWSTPTTLLAANSTASYHCAPTPTLLAGDGRLYRAFEVSCCGAATGALMLRTRAPLNATTDLASPSSWEATPAVYFDQSTMPGDGWQEGSAIEAPDGSIANMLRIDGQTVEMHNKAALLRLDPATFRLRFDSIIDFPATSSKFVVRLSPPTSRASKARPILESKSSSAAEPTLSDGLYYTLSTDVTPAAVRRGTVGARNHLILAVSSDLLSWGRCLTLLVDDTGLTPADSARYTGFHYVDWVFDGADILYAVRTGYRGANSYHNANRLTTKRLVGYAEACRLGLHWKDAFDRVGDGWCRPTTGWGDAGETADERECAQRCGEWGECAGFAMDPAKSSCSLYPFAPNASSGTAGISCFRRRSR